MNSTLCLERNSLNDRNVGLSSIMKFMQNSCVSFSLPLRVSGLESFTVRTLSIGKIFKKWTERERKRMAQRKNEQE